MARINRDNTKYLSSDLIVEIGLRIKNNPRHINKNKPNAKIVFCLFFILTVFSTSKLPITNLQLLTHNSKICSRSGPSDTNLIGVSASAEILSKYFWAFLGRSFQRRTWVTSSVQPGSSS